jgi:predicted DNA-binding mobile mystery protein A
MQKNIRKHARIRLDERLDFLKPESRFTPPPKGWIRAIRNALGMSASQLANRVGLRAAQSIEDIERSEISGTIQLQTLTKVAGALDCVVVYALVPKTSLEGMINARKRFIGIQWLNRVSHTMKLEAQGVDRNTEDMLEEIMTSIADRDLWNEA